MVFVELTHDATWFSYRACWPPGGQAEDEWLLEAWERMTLQPDERRMHVHGFSTRLQVWIPDTL